MPTINLGRIAVVPKGDWSAGTYKKLDTVRHSGAYWICNTTTTTETPSDVATDWDKVSQDGGGLTDLVLDTTPQLGGNLDGNSFSFVGSSYTQLADASVGTGTHTLDYSLGDYQKVTATGDFTLAFSNFVNGKVCSFIVEAVDWGSHTITLPAGLKFDSATLPTFTTTGTDKLVILKDKNDSYDMFVLGSGIGTA